MNGILKIGFSCFPGSGAMPRNKMACEFSWIQAKKIKKGASYNV